MTAPRIAARRLVNAEHESTHTKVIMPNTPQRALMLAAIVAVAACGDSSGPDTYPDMLGTYDLTASLPDGFGTINITGQQDSTLTGDATFVLGAWIPVTLTGLGFAAVQKNGSIRFTIAPNDPDFRLAFIGHANGSTMSGSQIFGLAGGPRSSWTATRR